MHPLPNPPPKGEGILILDTHPRLRWGQALRGYDEVGYDKVGYEGYFV